MVTSCVVMMEWCWVELSMAYREENGVSARRCGVRWNQARSYDLWKRDYLRINTSDFLLDVIGVLEPSDMVADGFTFLIVFLAAVVELFAVTVYNFTLGVRDDRLNVVSNWVVGAVSD